MLEEISHMDGSDTYAAAAERVFEFEQNLANHTLSRAALRDPSVYYNPMSLGDLLVRLGWRRMRLSIASLVAPSEPDWKQLCMDCLFPRTGYFRCSVFTCSCAEPSIHGEPQTCL